MPEHLKTSKHNTASNVADARLQAMLDQAIALHRNGQLGQAEAIYLNIIGIQPVHANCLNLLGVIATQTNNHERAVKLIDKAIEIDPNIARFYGNRGNALKELKQLDAAVASYDKAIAINPDDTEAYYNRGLALQELKQLDAAVASYDKAIAINPDDMEAYNNRGLVLQELKQPDAAVASYDRAIAIRPDFAEAYYNRGNALEEMKQLDAAVGSYDMAIGIKPDFAEAYGNRGLVLQELGQLDAALASCNNAIAIKPDSAEAYSNRGLVLQELKQLDAALASYEKTIAIDPDYPEAHFNKSLALMLSGNFNEGWRLYEWRWQSKGHAAPKRNFTQPLWLGNEPLNGKTLLLHSEQGLGDTIQFCRYAKLASELGARVILEVPKPLVALLNGLEGVAEMIEKGQQIPSFDLHCPLLSLPLAFRTDFANMPSAQAYLHSDASKTETWAMKLGAKKKLRVGLAWSGNTGHKNDHNRSIPLSRILPYLSDSCDYFSLQKDLRDADRATLEAQSRVEHFGDMLGEVLKLL